MLKRPTTDATLVTYALLVLRVALLDLDLDLADGPQCCQKCPDANRNQSLPV